jgi:hypothetical protein
MHADQAAAEGCFSEATCLNHTNAHASGDIFHVKR